MGSSLKGGLVTAFEGLDYSGGPCARGLSVAGFFATMGRFPGPEGFILRVREASFLLGEASLFDVPFNPVIPPCRRAVLRCTHSAGEGYCTHGDTLPGHGGRAYSRDTHPGHIAGIPTLGIQGGVLPTYGHTGRSVTHLRDPQRGECYPPERPTTVRTVTMRRIHASQTLGRRRE